jgi:hypothetical protein
MIASINENLLRDQGDQGEFSPFGWWFTLGSYLKITKVAHIFDLLSSTDEKWAVLHFGRLFHKLVWSSCPRPLSSLFIQ